MFPTLDLVFFDTRFLLSRIHVGTETVISEDVVSSNIVCGEDFNVPFPNATDYNSIVRKPRKLAMAFDGDGPLALFLTMFAPILTSPIQGW